MSGAAVAPAARGRWSDPSWRATAFAGTTLLAALVLALSARGGALSSRVVALALAAGGLTLVAVVLVPAAVQFVRGSRGRVALLVVPLLLLTPLLLLGVARLDGSRGVTVLVIALVAASCGLVLIADDLRRRARRAGERALHTPWQRMTVGQRVRWLPWRAVVGGLLVGWATLLAVGVIGPYLAYTDLTWMVVLVVAALVTLAVIGLPVLVGSVARGDRDRLAQAREDERLRVAAHLHDSVLQTLALVQRQAADPAAVTRLARGQERALRAWMAGEAELGAATLAGALHMTAEEVETEERVDVDVTVLGDRPLDAQGHALVGAAREALRNAARHARGTSLVVFAELSRTGAAVYVRDEGEGFELDAVPAERRGVRDAIVGRMAGVGGEATIDSVAGEGTEVALRFGDQAKSLGQGPRIPSEDLAQRARSSSEEVEP